MNIIPSIGLFHLMHSPILILFPYYVNRDMYYINYFLLIMLSYTFTNGECPITYVTKLYIDSSYIAGDTIHYFPEMDYYLTPYYTNLYFTYNTILYLLELVYCA